MVLFILWFSFPLLFIVRERDASYSIHAFCASVLSCMILKKMGPKFICSQDISRRIYGFEWFSKTNRSAVASFSNCRFIKTYLTCENVSLKGIFQLWCRLYRFCD